MPTIVPEQENLWQTHWLDSGLPSVTQQVWNSYRDLKCPGFTTLAFLSCENILQNYALMITAQGLCSFDWWVDLNELRLMRNIICEWKSKQQQDPGFQMLNQSLKWCCRYYVQRHWFIDRKDLRIRGRMSRRAAGGLHTSNFSVR